MIESKAETTTRTETQSPLDAAIDATSRQQSIRNTAAQFLGVPPKQACDLLRNVWKVSNNQPPLTDAEMFVGMSMIARFGLDPIAKEVYVTRTSKGLCTIVGLDGWIKILDRTEGYDGFEQEIHQDERGEIDWVETAIFSKKRKHATKYRAFASEYRKVAGPVASQLPSHMLRIFSLRHAARLFTPIGGSVVTEEEARWMDAYDQTPVDGRQRQNTLKTKVAAAADEFATDLGPEGVRTEAPAPSPPPAPARELPAAKEVITGLGHLAREPGDETEEVEAEASQTPDDLTVVTQYRAEAKACNSLKDANALVSKSMNDPILRRCGADAIKHIGEILTGNVTAWKQRKGGVA